MPDQSLLLLEVFQRVLTDVQLLFRSKRLRVWGVVPCVNVIPSKLNYLGTKQQPDDAYKKKMLKIKMQTY